MPTVFELQGDGSKEDLLVAAAARQNMRAEMQLPMNTVEWTLLVLQCAGSDLGTSFNRSEVLEVLSRCTKKYDSHIDVKDYDVEPLAKRARKGRRKSGTAQAKAILNAGNENKGEEVVDRIRMGRDRLKAIEAILRGATPNSLKMMEYHLVWAGDYNYCAFTDQSLGLPWLWPNSLPPQDIMATEAALVARDAAALASQKLIPSGATAASLNYEEPLTAAQHEMILEKAISIFEDEALHLTDMVERSAKRPKAEAWKDYRQVIQHWTQGIRECAHEDLQQEDFEELEKAILHGDAMDAQIITCLKRYPKRFHIGMLPDVRTAGALNDDLMAMKELAAEKAEWDAKLSAFKAKLGLDLRLIQTAKAGSESLQDLLDWHESDHLRKQGLLGKSLVKQFLAEHFPKATANGWSDVAGAVPLAMQSVGHPLPNMEPRVVALLDFNTPTARNSIKLQQIASSVATLFKTLGPERCVLYTFLATQPKEESEVDPIEDEVTIMKILQKAGFHAQQRIRMLLNQPASLENVLQVGDWWLDARLCYLSPNELAACGKLPDIPGNHWRMFSELARITSVTLRPTVPSPP